VCQKILSPLQTDTLWFFNEELCRSMPMVFDRDVVRAGTLPGFRFTPRSDVFVTPRTSPENACYCSGAERELCDMIGDGMFAISSCQVNHCTSFSLIFSDKSFRSIVFGQ
jgi:hypothetical protein